MNAVLFIVFSSCCCFRLSFSCGDIVEIIEEAKKATPKSSTITLTSTTTTNTQLPTEILFETLKAENMDMTTKRTTTSTKTTTTTSATTKMPAENMEAVMAHNNARRKELAANMNKLEWHNKLATMAKDWASKCKFMHGDTSDPDFDSIGQNIYITSSSTLNYTNVVGEWLKEKNFYDFTTGYCSGKTCGHYTQVVWADTILVGCGYQLCTPIVGSSLQRGYLVVCNYSPAGNFLDEDPFLSGDRCSMCYGPCEEELCTNQDL